MDSIKKLLVSLAGWVKDDEESVKALLDLFQFVRARELPKYFPRIVDMAYGNPICFVVAVRNVPKVAIFGSDKVKFDNFILEKELEASGAEMTGDIKNIGEGAIRKLDTEDEEERLEDIILSDFVKHIELDEAMRRSAEIVKELTADDSFCYMVFEDDEPRAGIFQFHEDDLGNFIFGWHPEWVARTAAWRKEVAANERGEIRTFFSINQLFVRCLCIDLAGGDEEARDKAFRSLREMDCGGELLIEALHDDEMGVRAGAARALGELGIEEAIPHIVEMIANSGEDDYGDRTRIFGFWALVNLGQAGVDPLIEMFASPDEDIRGKAIWALGKIGDRRAARPIMDMLGDEEGFVRRDAAVALGRFKEQEAVDPLIERLDDEDAEVRWAAAISLKKLGDRKALGPLEAHLDDDDEDTREGMQEAIDGLSALTNDGS